MNPLGVVIGGLIGFISSLVTGIVQHWRENHEQRKVAFGWLQIEVEINLEKIRKYHDQEPRWRDPLTLQIKIPPFHREAYQALIYQSPPFSHQDRDILKLAALSYDRLGMIEFLVEKFNEREPQGKHESLGNLMKAVKAAQGDEENLLKVIKKRGIQ